MPLPVEHAKDEARPASLVPALETRRPAKRLGTRLAATRRRQNLLVIGFCVIVVAAGVWMYVGIERSLRDLRAQGLPALLDAKTKSLEGFIAERRADGERWAMTPRLPR